MLVRFDQLLWIPSAQPLPARSSATSFTRTEVFMASGNSRSYEIFDFPTPDLVVTILNKITVPGATQTWISDINDHGQLAGVHQDSVGQTHGFLATPRHPDE